MGIDAGGEAGTGEGKESPKHVCLGLVCSVCEGMVKRGRQAEKTPCRSYCSGGGLNTRAACTLTYTARLPARRRLHRSAPLERATATRIVRPRSPRASRLLLMCIDVSQPRGGQEAPQAPALRGCVRCHDECLQAADRLGAEADLAIGEQMDDGREDLLFVRGDLAHRLHDLAESYGSALGTSHRLCLLASLSARRSALRSGVWSRVSI
jgi:hypothetical protein